MSLRLEIHGQIAHLLIDRADKRNAFNMAMWQAMPELFERAANNTDLKLMIIRAAEPSGAF
ncbi:MAG: hypothetical protein ABJG26_08100, partial [Marinomonas sp.]